ncbi:MAG TPA: alpha-L-arabinofuranosidase C-terminal domain-containing protein [Chitinophagaceae bacterium]|nr:alpha-L-arabinofuranosidase C-terminal domain-containing protein [Chitinophagaceae bacterium]
MKKRFLYSLCCLLIYASVNAQSNSIIVHADKKGAPIQPTMWGLFFEDINFAADGGLYAELVKNRSFEFNVPLMGWRRLVGRIPRGRIEVFNSGNENNPRYVQIINNSSDTVVGIQNDGFRGMGVHAGGMYNFSVIAKKVATGEPQLSIELVTGKGNIIGKTTVSGLTNEWKKHKASFTVDSTDAKASLRVMIKGAGTVQMDMISLFPNDTWKGRENGLRKDMVQKLADLKPGFIRFPGGCIVEGRDLANRYQWKKTIGNLEDRKVIINRWSTEIAQKPAPDYYQSYGLGFYEYFLLAEDLGAEPLPILNCGMACQFNTGELATMEALDPFVQDAYDLIEFANGSTNTKWGKLRAQLGHPEPFKLKKIGVGNEQWGPEYVTRAKVFFDALKQKHPEIQLIGSAGPYSGGENFDYLWKEMKKIDIDLVDEHYYSPPQWFLRNARRYDNYDTTGPLIFAGEFAAHDRPGEDGRRKNNWLAAITEAAFMTGLERNAKIISMASYAPLFAHVDAWQWSPNLIWFNNLSSFATPNYYVQQLFSTNKGSYVVPALMNDKAVTGQDSLYASATIDVKTNEIILKIINVNPVEKPIAITINGNSKLAKRGLVTTMLSADMQAENSIDNPSVIQPKTNELTISGKNINYKAAPSSVNVIRIKRS